MPQDAVKTWLITGVSRGIGREIAQAALAQGDSVAGTVRSDKDAQSFRDLAPERAHAFIVDMASPTDIERTVRSVADTLGSIDILVNNAGYGLVGAIEEYSEQEVRHQMEVNFFGPLRAMQTVLPFMRERRSGHIINLSSIAGIAPYAGFGIYCASKYALEGASASLAREVIQLGIRVTLIEPGAIRTDWAGSSMVHAARIIDAYADTTGQVRSFFESYYGKQPGDPKKVAQAVLDIADARDPPLHLVLGSDAWERINEERLDFGNDLETWHQLSLSTDISSARTP